LVRAKFEFVHPPARDASHVISSSDVG